MFKIAICDDVPVVCSEIKDIIMNLEDKAKYPKIEVGIFQSGEALIDSINEEGPYDLLFLDIELGEINGVEIGHIIREQMEDYVTKIVYISSKDIYDRQLFDVQPLHFIKKPIDPEKVIQDIELAMKISKKENDIFEFKVLRNTIKVPYKEILYFESDDREVILVSARGRYTFYESIQNLIKKLPDFFIQPHRSYLVNYESISCFYFEELVMHNGDVVPISRNKRKEIRDKSFSKERRRKRSGFGT